MFTHHPNMFESFKDVYWDCHHRADMCYHLCPILPLMDRPCLSNRCLLFILSSRRAMHWQMCQMWLSYYVCLKQWEIIGVPWSFVVHWDNFHWTYAHSLYWTCADIHIDNSVTYKVWYWYSSTRPMQRIVSLQASEYCFFTRQVSEGRLAEPATLHVWPVPLCRWIGGPQNLPGSDWAWLSGFSGPAALEV